MVCSSCGYESDPSHRFCINCGQQFAQGCVQCGTPLPPDARFCATCGTAVGDVAAPPPQEAPPVAQLEETVAFLGNLPIFQYLSP